MTACALQQQELFADDHVDRPRIDDPWFYRGEATSLGVDAFGAERFARVHAVLERFRSAEDRAGERDGLPVNTNGVKQRMRTMEPPPPPEEVAARHKLSHHDPDRMAATNGLWINVGCFKDYRGRLTVNGVCTGPGCSGSTPPRTRKFRAFEWTGRQTSCSGCATYRRRMQRAAEATTAQERVERLLHDGCCIVCAKPNPTLEHKRCPVCRQRQVESNKRHCRRESTKRPTSVRYLGKDTK